MNRSHVAGHPASPIRPAFRAPRPALALGALALALACRATGDGASPAAAPGAGDLGGAWLVVHSGGLDEALRDPRDAGLRRALEGLDARVLELPAVREGRVPPGAVAFLLDAMRAPWTLRVEPENEPNDERFPLRVQWTVETGSVERADELEQRFQSLLALLPFRSGSADDRPELSEVETPQGSFFHGTIDGGTTFLVAWGEPPTASPACDWTDLPRNARPSLALGMDFGGLLGFAQRMAGEEGESLDEEPLRGLREIGLDALRMTLAFGTGPERSHFAARYANWVPLADAMGALPDGPIPAAALQRIPADATLAMVSRGEPTSALWALDRLPPEVGLRALEEFRAATGTDLRADVLQPLGQVSGIYLSDSTGGGGLLSGVLFVELDDEARTAATLETWMARLASWKEAAESAKLRVRPFEHDGARGRQIVFAGLPVPLSPAWAIQDGTLYAAATPQALIGALDQARSGAPGLRAHPALARERLGALDDLQGLTFVDSARLAREGYGIGTLVFAALENALRSEDDPARDPGPLLPPFGELVAGVRPTLFLARIEGSDLVARGTSDRSVLARTCAFLGCTPMVSGLLAVAGLGARAGVQTEASYPDDTPEGQAHADLRALNDAVMNYAIENGGRFPDSLEDLLVPDEEGYRWFDADELPLDPWGNPYVYEHEGPNVRIFSYGSDGLPGGEGDARDLSSDDPDLDSYLDSDEEEWEEMEMPVLEDAVPEDER